MLDTHKLEKARGWLENNLMTMREAARCFKVTFKLIAFAVDMGALPKVRGKYLLKGDVALYLKRLEANE